MFHSAKFYRRTCLGCFATVALTKFRCGAKHWRLVKDSAGNDGITGGAANIDNTEMNNSSNTSTDESHSNTDDGKVLKGGVEKHENADQPDDREGAEDSAESNSHDGTDENSNDGKDTPADNSWNLLNGGEIFNLLKLKSILIAKNNHMNHNYPEAKNLMNISLIGTKHFKNSKIFKIIDSQKSQNLFKNTGIKLAKNLDCVVFDRNSDLSNKVADSKDFRDAIEKAIKKGSLGKPFVIELKNNENLFRALHNITAYNTYIDKYGYLHATCHDVYDFKWEKGQNYIDKKFTIIGINNIAYILQQLGILQKYSIIIDIKAKY